MSGATIDTCSGVRSSDSVMHVDSVQWRVRLISVWCSVHDGMHRAKMGRTELTEHRCHSPAAVSDALGRDGLGWIAGGTDTPNRIRWPGSQVRKPSRTPAFSTLTLSSTRRTSGGSVWRSLAATAALGWPLSRYTVHRTPYRAVPHLVASCCLVACRERDVYRKHAVWNRASKCTCDSEAKLPRHACPLVTSPSFSGLLTSYLRSRPASDLMVPW